MANERERDDGDDRKSPFFSCAFCSESSEKPFKICESCGTAQPASDENKDEEE